MNRPRFKWWIIKNWFKMLFYWCLAKLDIQLSKDPIPEGVYCYVPDIEKNTNIFPGKSQRMSEITNTAGIYCFYLSHPVLIFFCSIYLADN